MPNKTRFVIYPDRDYVVNLSNGDEVTVTGKEIASMISMKQILRYFAELDEMELNNE